MSVLAMKQALEVIEAAIESGDWQIDGACDPSMAIHSLHEAIAEAEKQEPVAWIVDGEIKVRLDMAGKLYYSETNVYTAPVHASDISQERVDETAKRKHEFECPRCGHCCQVRTHTPEDVKKIESKWVGLDGDIPDLGLVTEEFYNGMLCAEDILRRRNT